MIHFKVPCAGRKTYSVTLTPDGHLTVTGDVAVDVQLSVADIRARYGNGWLLVYVYHTDAAGLAVGVFPGEDWSVLHPDNKAFLKANHGAALILEAVIPITAQSWGDSEVRVISPDPRSVSYVDGDPIPPIQVVHNEDGYDTAYLMQTPLRIRFMPSPGEVHETRI